MSSRFRTSGLVLAALTLAACAREERRTSQPPQSVPAGESPDTIFPGGGGMGPALMDDEWRYGGRIDQIVASITEGRPNGMPSWRNKLTPDQIWKIAAYVRSMSGQPSKDAVSSRADAMSATTPDSLT